MIATLTYHSIDDSGSPVSVSPAAFEGHIRWLTSGAVRVQPLDELVSPAATEDHSVAVTFDDGFANTRDAIRRLLDLGIVPTIFVVSGQAGGTNAWGGRDQRGIPTLPLLGWSDLEELAARGAKIEAHSRTHPALTRLTRQRRDDELGGCQEDLLARLGIRCAHFAYPYGDVNEEVAGQAGAHFRFAHTTEMRALTGADRPMRLPRLDAYYFRTPDGLEAFGSESFQRRLAFIRARRRLRSLVAR